MKMICAVNQYKEEIKHNKAFYECMTIFEEYLSVYGKDLSGEQLTLEMIERFFIYWLPENYGSGQEILGAFFPAVTGFCSFLFLQCRRTLFSISGLTAGEFARVIRAKHELIKSICYPILSFSPYVIDMRRYREYKSGKQPQECFFEQGFFEIMDIYEGNRLILKKISGHTMFVKVILNISAVRYLKNSDILDINIKRKVFASNWEITKVRGCYLKEVERFAKANGKVLAFT